MQLLDQVKRDQLEAQEAPEIKSDEGLRLKPYKDTRGIETVGYGFNLNEGFDEEECDWILDHRLSLLIGKVQAALSANLAGKIDTVRFCALVNMAYEMGVVGLLEFHQFLSLLESACTTGNYQLAVDALASSLWAQQVPARAARIMKQILTGVMQ